GPRARLRERSRCTPLFDFRVGDVTCNVVRAALRKTLLKFGRLLANLEPVEKCVGLLEPNREPARDFFFFSALRRIHFVIARDHFGATPAETGDFQNPRFRFTLSLGTEFPQ